MNRTHYKLPEPAKVDSQKVNRLTITKDGKTIELTRKDDRWYIEPKGYPADDIKVKNMVKAAVDLTVTDLISESGNYDRYDLNNGKEIRIQAFVGKEKVRNFDLGKTASTYQHTFARLGDNPDVYQVRGALNATFNHTVDDLRDLLVLSFDKGQINALTIEKGTHVLTLAKKELPQEKKSTPAEGDKKDGDKEEKKAAAPDKPKTQWQEPDGKAVDQPVVDQLLNEFSNFKCSGYLDDNAAAGLKNPIWKLTFGNGKESRTFSVFEKEKPDATEYPAISSTTAYAFLISKNREEQTEKGIDKLLDIVEKAPQTKTAQ